MIQPGKQPFISSIGRKEEQEVTNISCGGNNFGDDIDNLTIVIYESLRMKMREILIGDY